MTEKKNVEVCFSPLSYSLFKSDDSIVVVIDVLRATSAICTAIYHGVKGIIPVADVNEATEYKNKGYLVGAERHGVVVSGFDLGNSPFSYMKPEVKGKMVVLTTTNGTQAIHAAKNAHKVVIGSFLNLTMLTQWLLDQDKNVVLLCAGWKNKFNLEDSLFAGAVAQQLCASEHYYTDCDSTRAAQILYKEAKGDLYGFLENSSHRQRLEKLHLEEDIRYCLTLDKAPAIPILENGVIVRLNPTPVLAG